MKQSEPCQHLNIEVQTITHKINVCKDCSLHLGATDRIKKRKEKREKRIKSTAKLEPFTPARVAAWTMYYGEHDGKLLKDIPVEYLVNILAYNDPLSNISRAVKAFLQSGVSK